MLQIASMATSDTTELIIPLSGTSYFSMGNIWVSIDKYRTGPPPNCSM